MIQLIKPQDNFILVSDEQPVRGWYFDTFINKVRNTNGAEYGVNDTTKQIIAGIPELPSIDFSLLSEAELSNLTTANVEVILKNNVYLITKIIKDENN